MVKMSKGDALSSDLEKDLEFAGCFIFRVVGLPFAIRTLMVLGIPDIMEEAGPGAQLTAEDIASRLATPSADSQSLDRILRLLASQKVVTEVSSASPKDPNIVERRFGTTPLMKCLASTFAGGFLNSFARLLTSPQYMASMNYMDAPVLNAKSREPFFLAHGKGIFEFMEMDSELQMLFENVMDYSTKNIIPPLLETYKGFEGLSSVVDVGGGVGFNLAQVLPKYPHLRGINFDQPHVVANGLQVPRLEHVGGDFFESVPQADAVWMKWILHDWSDEHCVKILKNVYKALPPQGKVMNLDMLLPEVSDSSLKTQTQLLNDVLMMSYCHGGKERSLSQFQKIAADAGFTRVEVVADVGSHSVMEFYK